MSHLADTGSILCQHYITHQPMIIEFEGGQVNRVDEVESDSASTLWYAPVFIDIQINGFQGINFSESKRLTVDDVAKVVGTLRSHGVGYFLPTVTTSSFDNIHRSFETLSASCQNPDVARSIPGFHLEGPYISSEDGPRGAHPLEHARAPSWDEFQRWQEAANGMIKLVTLAPELPGAISFIEKLRRKNIIPAIGHTNAETHDIENAVEAGAVLSTHLGNGAHAMIRRHPNYIWDQLANDNLTASLIPDGFHLPPNVLKTMIRAKGIEKSILVTDAVTVAGLEPGEYIAGGKAVELTADGVVKLSGTDYLAGAALKMSDGIFNTAQFAEIEPRTAIEMASYHPYRLLRTHTDVSLNVLSHDIFTILKWGENSLEVIATSIDGQINLYQNPQEIEGGSV